MLPQPFVGRGERLGLAGAGLAETLASEANLGDRPRAVAVRGKDRHAEEHVSLELAVLVPWLGLEDRNRALEQRDGLAWLVDLELEPPELDEAHGDPRRSTCRR